MKRLDNIIRDNSELFDSEEPDEGHFERFEKKLNTKNKTRRLKTYKKLLNIAAVIVLVITTGIIAYFQTNPVNKMKTSGIALGEVSEEYREVEIYLKSNVDEKIENLKKIQCRSEEETKEVIRELDDIDNTYKELQKELLKNDRDERIINAMINCYQVKVEVLDQLIKQLKENC